jgi:hypothetical protein
MGKLAASNSRSNITVINTKTNNKTTIHNNTSKTILQEVWQMLLAMPNGHKRLRYIL